MGDKKQYQEVLLTLKGIATIDATHRKLTRIETTTDDPKLKALLKPCLSLLEKAFVVAQIRRVHGQKSRLDLCASPYSPLAKYCDDCMSSEAPAWQIVAEQHGWKP